jgi:magnesium-transporting ATPase (P-type)
VDEKIEVNLELVGSTAIEDRLQEEVAETIQFIK